MIPIVCGDPRNKPATYTRFILPFGYELQHGKPCQAGSVAYSRVVDSPDWIWRVRYLTDETSEVLFRRGRWFKIPDPLWEKIRPSLHARVNGSELTVMVAPPTVVLFEFPSEPVSAGQIRSDLLQVGFLIIEIFFPNSARSETKEVRHPQLDDLLLLNELFRNWQRPFDGHESRYASILGELPVSLLDEKGPKISQPGGLDPYFDRWATLLDIPIEEGGVCRRLFPDDWQDRAQHRICAERKLETDIWDVYADPRTFVWTCAIVEAGGKKLRETFSVPAAEALGRPTAPWNYGHWVKLLNVDPPCSTLCDTHECRNFEREWARDRTYKRWEECGTFYGFSYHSGAMLGDTRIDKEHPEKEPEPPLWRHFGTMYFDQTLLILYIRVVLFRFSTRLSMISAQARDNGRRREKWRDFESLRWDFALFTNLYQFPLLSNQQQGLEMYALARRSMDVDELFREVQQEIQATSDYLMQRCSQEQAVVSNKLTELSTRLSIIAAFILPAGLAFSFLGMSIVPQKGDRLVEGLNWLFSKIGAYKISDEWGLFAWVFLISLCLCLLLYGVSIGFMRFWKRIRPGGANDEVLPSSRRSEPR